MGYVLSVPVDPVDPAARKSPADSAGWRGDENGRSRAQLATAALPGVASIDLRSATLARASRDLVAGIEMPILCAICFMECPSICSRSTTDRTGFGSRQMAFFRCSDLSYPA